ncbi:MAG: glycosyltransferase family 2 protein [Desulfobacterales bacterium]|nr:glycosyltransferase family 2 protein [Desulfobacterales bacterium]
MDSLIIHKTALIILHYGNPCLTYNCIDSIQSSHGGFYPVIILIDNDPENRFHLSMLKKNHHLIYLKQPKNLGFAVGVNLGIQKAIELDKSIFLLINNDVIVSPDTIFRLVSLCKHHKCIAGGIEYAFDAKGVKTSEIIFAGGDLVWRELPLKLRKTALSPTLPYATQFVRGSCMAVPVEIIHRIGLFTSELWAYGEDVDFCIRAAQAGYQLMIDPNAHLWHKVSASVDSWLRNYLMARNNLYLIKKYATGTDFYRAFLLSFVSACISVFRPDRFGKFRGFIAGLDFFVSPKGSSE